MSHTTGLPGWRWFEPDQKLRIHYEPGEKFSCSGEAMTLLQIVIQKIAAKPLEQLMHGHVLSLTIADTFTPLEWENYIPYDRVRPGLR